MIGEESNTPTDRTSDSQPRASPPSPAAPAHPTEDPDNSTATSSSSPNDNAPTGDTDDQAAEIAAVETTGNSSFESGSQASILAPNPLIAISAAISSSEGPRSRRFRQSRRSRRSPSCPQLSHCSRQLCLLMIYPSMVVMTIIGLIVILVFCILPTIMFIGIGICLYYCCHSDPVPLPLLLRRLIEGREDLRTSQTRMEHFDPNSERVQALRDLYRSKLIVRKVLRIQTTDGDSDRDVDLDSLGFPQTQARGKKNAKNNNGESIPTIDQRSNIDPKDTVDKKLTDERLFRNHKFPIRIRTDHSIIHYSAPLEVTANASDKQNDLAKESREIATGDTDDIDSIESDFDINIDNDNENSADFSDFVPHYQRSFGDDVVGDATEIQADSVTSSNEFSVDRNTEDESGNCECKDIEKCDGKINQNFSLGYMHTEKQFVYFEDMARDPRLICDICMLEYEVGDEIAWSPNLNCKHSFHKDCILDWLIRKPTCPCCRQDYLNSSTDDNV